jgi:hypothetical protein
MSNDVPRSRSRRAFLTGAAGVAGAMATARVDAQPRAVSTSQPRDLGLWATWYDLPEAERSSHVAWVHEAYIPGLLKRPGYLWAAHYATMPNETSSRVRHTDDASVPTGGAYILVVGGEDSNVFGRPGPDNLNADLPQESKKMLAMRVGVRTNIFAEGARVTGPASKDYKDGMTLAPCIQFGSYNVDYRKEVDILEWYAQLQMPILEAAPGCVRTRKLASVFGWAKMGILYEFASVDARNKHFSGGRGGTPHKWQNSVSQLIHAPGGPSVARRIWPAA